MASKDLILDPSEYDLNHCVADLEEIRRHNPQRYEMEQLTAVVLDDPARNICVGYKDYSRDEFWIRGHMPGMPVLPGVLMCEAAAQLCSYFVRKHKMLEGDMIGFGGLHAVRFRDVVTPGDRLVLVASLLRIRPGVMISARFQGLVRDSIVCEGEIKGVRIPLEAITGRTALTG
ncbi:MAG TPA: 3-hydroxyacyl-ACP dehydratase FabZ family protein [Pirellulales bacterium]|jgi:3-hydroxyacyl-[acyl-carrier-protein] dehydratase